MTAARDAHVPSPARRVAPARRALPALLVGILLAVGAVGLSGASAGPARALSCIPVDIHDALRDADFAFIGRPALERGAADNPSRQFVFDVEVWVKGNLGTPVTVNGFEWSSPQIGERMAMIVNRGDDGQLRDNPCVWTSPETLLAIAELYAESPSGEAPALLLGGVFGSSRLIALDSRGRLAGFGAGEGAIVAMTACPGGQRMVELVAEYAHDIPLMAAVRDTATLEVLREIVGLGFGETGLAWPAAFSCRDSAADEILYGLPGAGIGRLSGKSVETAHAGSFTTFAIGRQLAVATEPGVGLHVLDLASGERQELHQPGPATEPVAYSFSADESLLAYLGRAPYESVREGMTLILYDVASGDVVASQIIDAPRNCSCWGSLAWLEDGSLLVQAQRWTDDGQQLASTYVFSAPELELVDEWPAGYADAALVAGGVLVAIERAGGPTQLVLTDLHDGRRVPLRTLATNNATGLLALPGFDGVALLAQGPESPPPSSPGTTAPTPTPGSPPPGQPTTPTEGDSAGLLVPAVLLVAALLVLAGAVLARRRLS